MASLSLSSAHFSSTSSSSRSSISTSSLSPSSTSLPLLQSPIRRRYRSLRRRLSFSVIPRRTSRSFSTSNSQIRCSINEPLKVMISGAPASGKGTQCELIVHKFGLVHISTGDLLRAEVSSGTDIGKRAKEFMNSGSLVPDEIVIAMVAGRLSREDAKEHGWLLDGFPRSFAQAQSLDKLNVKPDIFILLDVPDEILIDRCVGRRLDPVTGKIYHIKNYPPESDEIKARLVTRPDDTEEKVKARLQIYKQNSEAIISAYSDVMVKIDANRPKEVVFEETQTLLSQIQLKRMIKTDKASPVQDKWRGIPTRLNNIPHSRDIRAYFYEDVLQATIRSIKDGNTRLRVDINIPELNPEMDVYRIGTLMELVQALALSFADDGKRVKVCVQGSMGEGALAGMPLQLAGTRKILEYMDWGDDETLGTFVKLGAIGGKEVDEEDDMFILVAPQNAVGNCIIDDLQAMTTAAGKRPVVLINPRLKDLPASSGIMQTMGREQRLEYALTFDNCYVFRLLYYLGTQYPIMGALRMSYPYRYELYKRVNEENGKEKYVLLATYAERPTPEQIDDAFSGKSRDQSKKASGIWGFLSSVFS
ncbi:adenylate kinase family protein [Arabidopsis thaliana]|uniref:Adenylate kinase 5, chloroplastic n=2 Tax=Arabidopsis thaliana TaxID=3702 RepID=KAD5_ARATH|nr:adenylate kinase family protein [Arabidopsis thaliana]Q8VYL1.1 RecName: Full=Adenylate kinase 5, chloroplastic; AltName: Full=ATP-AMP transphosphorylase 5; AltName: Full=ATP:AMP phosphotransferase; AltName: Full=Adenylate monophosphate kinase 5; Short=AMK5; Flags: Precursor [Arabidopsis thaliana]AAL49859.1 putative adenylate kinase [Arabidopsis thaliana]AAM91697.1 putative adenylate kinase [Arabidopsis thaliana]AED93936.1 adenylate kinase family protein [Arabidopsis thaliana]BAE98401.1 aden|eukprot:NP_198367.2 adenylate kinase family protein [Arabidopsis thaliana]